MKGHEPIIALRKAGFKPDFVCINDYNCDTDWDKWGETATVCVANEPIKTLDLRFLVGLRVSISGSDESRVKALFDACKRASCKQVLACHIQDGVPSWKQAGWVGVWNG